MFVTAKKYQKVVALAATLHAKLVDAQVTAQAAINVASELHQKLQERQRAHSTVPQFNDDQLRELLQLVHPDKHGGKASAIRPTQHINALREK